MGLRGPKGSGLSRFADAAFAVGWDFTELHGVIYRQDDGLVFWDGRGVSVCLFVCLCVSIEICRLATHGVAVVCFKGSWTVSFLYCLTSVDLITMATAKFTLVSVPVHGEGQGLNEDIH